MALRTARDRRLTGQDSLTNVLSGTATTGTGGVTGEETQSGITETPKEGAGAGPVTTTQAQQQNQQQAQQQSQQQSNVATKMPKQPARSGMFTNVKKILEKNQPAVQQMGQQAGQQFATTAEKVKQQAQQQFQNVQGQIQQAQKDVQSQEEAGKKAIESVVTSPLLEETAPVETAKETPATAEELLPEAKGPTLADFGSTAEQIAQGTSQLDLGKKIQEARELQTQAQGIMTDASKRNLLRDVFGRGQRQYTSGAQSLDNLLLAMSPEAGKRLKETVTSASRGLEDIARQQQAGTQAFQELQQQASGVGDILGRQSEQAIASQMEGVAGSKKSYLQERKGILEDIISGANQMVQNRLDFLSDYSFKPVKDSNNIIQYSNPLSLNYFDRQGLDKLGYDRDKFKEIIKNAPRRLEKFKEVKDTWESHDTGFGETYLHSKEQKKEHNETIDNYMDEIREYFKAGANPEMESVNGMEINPYALKAINQYLSKENRPTLSDLVSGSDIDPEGFYGFSDKNIAKINAIRRLRGEEEIVPSQSYYSLEDLQNLLGDKGGYERQNLYDYILSPYYKL